MTFNWSTEPALIIGAVDALLILAVTFGVPIDSDQKTAIDGVLAAVLTLVGSVVVRSQVTPSARLAALAVPTPAIAPPADAAPVVAPPTTGATGGS